MRILFVGHFGGRNIGDEIILLNQLKLFRNKFGSNTEFIIYSYEEIHTKNIYKDFKVETVKAFSLRNAISSYIDIHKKINNIDFMILGGGGLIQDVYFSYGIYRYILPVFIGFRKNIPYYTFSLGASKISLKANINILSRLIKFANGISIRDEYSKEIFNLNNKIGFNQNIIQIPDSANILVSNNLFNEEYIILVVRDFFTLHVDKIIEIINKIDYNFDHIKIIVFENNQIEIELAELLNEMLEKNNFKTKIIFDINPYNYLNIIERSRLIISGRLHGVIPSAILHKDFIALSYAPKIASFCKENNFKYIDIKDFSNDFQLDIKDYINSNYQYTQDLSKFDDFMNLIEKTHNIKPNLKYSKFSRSIELIKLNLNGIYLILVHIIGKILKKEKLSE